MSATAGVSVVVCCYDSAVRLPDTLLHLARQAVPNSIPWEVIVVDNASPDASADVALQSWTSYGSPSPMRVVEQPIPGVSAAREKGSEAARYEFILFCDDDNWLGVDYVRRVFELLVEHPEVGAVGGQGRASCVAGLPEWFARYDRYFAVGPQARARGAIEDPKGYLYGAGLAVRRAVLEEIERQGVRRRLSDRTPGMLTSGGDVELCYLIRLLGYDLWFDPDLAFVHFMPPGRMRWTYFLNLVEGTHRSRPYLDAYRRAVRGDDADVGSRQWLAECWKIAWHALRSPATLLRAAVAREGSHASYLWHRWAGDWIGWWTVRAEYEALYRELVSLRRELQRQPPAWPAETTPADEPRLGSQAPVAQAWAALVDPLAGLNPAAPAVGDPLP
jgi:glycosyltransferase involved in cell wall biosynthesis